jgi:CheY-like chemotaxis protein
MKLFPGLEYDLRRKTLGKNCPFDMQPAPVPARDRATVVCESVDSKPLLPSPNSIAGPRSMKTILIVEDDPTTGRLYQGLLRKEGFEVPLALDGLEAIDYLNKTAPDVVLLDLMLPKKNGVEVLKYIRSRAPLRNLPVIVLTHAYMGSLMRDAIRSGATHCLAKSQSEPKRVIQTILGYVPTNDMEKPEGQEAVSSDSMLIGASSPATSKKPEQREWSSLDSVLGRAVSLLLTLRTSVQWIARSSQRTERRRHLAKLVEVLTDLEDVVQEARLDMIHRTCTAIRLMVQELQEKGLENDSSELLTLAQGIDVVEDQLEMARQKQTESPKTPLVLLLGPVADGQSCAVELLIALGVRCIALADPTVALTVLSSNCFDLVIVDDDLPAVRGFDFCRRLRQYALHPRTPILLLASPATVERWGQSVIGGAVEFLCKPVSFRGLAAKALLTARVAGTKQQLQEQSSPGRVPGLTSATTAPVKALESNQGRHNQLRA